MRILVTGGTGVIGRAALPALLGAGHEVRLLSRHADEAADAWPASVEPYPVDLAVARDLERAVAGCTAVLHIAGIDEERPPEVTFEKINVAATHALCGAAERAGRPFLLYVSSLGAERGASAYHRSKFRAEQHVRAYAGRWLILRPGNVYGPGDETISLLLKMTRTLPAVPIVGAGDQPFQPLWCDDLGAALVHAMGRDELAGQTLELAGPEVTTTQDVLDRLARITGCHPARLPVPTWLAQAGTAAAAAFDAWGGRLADRAGLGMPLNEARLQMLIESNVLTRSNALTDTFGVSPTSLDDGLARLADLLPENPPGEGVGRVERRIYAAEITGDVLPAAGLLAQVCDHLGELMPLDFQAEPGSPASLREGETFTLDLPGRGHVQVRLAERTAHRVTFVTLAGHPLAGLLSLRAEAIPAGVRFAIETVSQPANALDWLALHTLGGFLQSRNWHQVVRRVVERSGGTAPAGVQAQAEPLADDEVAVVTAHLRKLLAQQHRAAVEAARASD